ncbi:putative glycerol-3-phosphate dehydrogenase [Astathelohania contejeani]|uniref:Glycerol-3-phosphate dehydrogenase n=1 Tax=Astathelohania contejeani TaxID=164912 RepID=A0ABQ7HY25_9MICR|nr:putative glycerol-3-phosphate dehydrogenase [Thelohania contejeani]
MKSYVFWIPVSTITGYACYRLYKYHRGWMASLPFQSAPPLEWQPKSRNEIIGNLKNKEYDLLIIGGGATGAGCALDAVTRGLKVALVEAQDFASETSSKSTKLLHGGIRYLEKAVNNLDYTQYHMVVEALHERKRVMDMVPYLCQRLPIMLPVYKTLQIPYFWFGLKLYDWFSGTKSVGNSFFIGPEKVKEKFPLLNCNDLKGAIVYFDAIHNDSRTNTMVAMTAAYYGADILNYAEVQGLTEDDGRVNGAKVKDIITHEDFLIKAKGVINATGPFVDSINKMASEDKKSVIPSSGIHLVLPEEYSPTGMGLVNANTKSGSVIFFIPWHGKSIVGSTDMPCKIKRNPEATNKEINFLIKEINGMLSLPKLLTKRDILSSWSGIRPLMVDPTKDTTQDIARTHVIHEYKPGLLTISGGKWTTFRKMAQETVDQAINLFKLTPQRICITNHIKLLGAHNYEVNLFSKLQNQLGIPIGVAKHLSNNYGDRAYKFYFKDGCINKLSPKYEYLEKEVEYCVKNEMAVTINDIICRRMRLGFIDVDEASKVVSKVGSIMKPLMGWSNKEMKRNIKMAKEYLSTLGINKDI